MHIKLKMLKLVRGFVLLACSVCLFAAVCNAAEPRKILYFSLSSGFEHSTVVSKDGQPSVSDIAITAVCKPAGIEVVCTKDGKIFDKDLSPYAAILFQTSGEMSKGTKEHPDWALTDTGWRNILTAVRNGKGFVAFHPTTDANRILDDNDTPTEPEKITEFTKFLGAQFTTHGNHQEGTVSVVEPTPFAWFAAKGQYRYFEEWYCHKNFQNDIHVFALLETKGLDGVMYKRPPMPLVWGRAEGKGRVLYSAFGHYDNYWQDKNNMEFVLQLIQAAVGDLKVDLTPNIQTAAPGANTLKE
ncbi:hypothetical protein FACS189443_0560 [Planctomycetales bacterium]|nr:hypothetical protein FACS189443_0560 [Planctomycetales bacterium]